MLQRKYLNGEQVYTKALDIINHQSDLIGTIASKKNAMMYCPTVVIMIIIKMQLQTLQSTMVTCLHNTLLQWWHRRLKVTNHSLVGHKAHYVRWNLAPLGSPRALIGHGTREKTNITVQLKEHSHEITPNNILFYPQISVSLSIIREASSYSK